VRHSGGTCTQPAASLPVPSRFPLLCSVPRVARRAPWPLLRRFLGVRPVSKATGPNGRMATGLLSAVSEPSRSLSRRAPRREQQHHTTHNNRAGHAHGSRQPSLPQQHLPSQRRQGLSPPLPLSLSSERAACPSPPSSLSHGCSLRSAPMSVCLLCSPPQSLSPSLLCPLAVPSFAGRVPVGRSLSTREWQR
jgi:hypothetical protein